MKLRHFPLQASLVTLALTVIVTATSAGPAIKAAARQVSDKGPLSDKGPSAVPAELPVPQSVFVAPKKVSDGRDPFFPNSTRPYGAEVVVKAKGTSPAVAELHLKGISGTAEKPLAIVNTTTFTSGEENDVLSAGGRLRIRCLEINMAAGTVLVQVGGERRELRLQGAK